MVGIHGFSIEISITEQGNRENNRKTPPSEDLTYYAELKKGDAFIMLASCFHGGSANTTTGQYRLVFGTFTTRGWLEQEENVDTS
jgi:ectoine hydroxylase-related dioxygenase (phytanoyl-CoA dioxygenase family)